MLIEYCSICSLNCLLKQSLLVNPGKPAVASNAVRPFQRLIQFDYTAQVWSSHNLQTNARVLQFTELAI